MSTMKRSQGTSVALLLLRKKDGSCLAISRRPRKQILNLIEREPPVDETSRFAGRNSVLMVWFRRERLDFIRISRQKLVPTPGTSDLAVQQAFSFVATPPDAEQNGLSITNALGFSKAVNANIAELRRKNGAAFADALRWNHQNEHASGSQPAVDVF